MESTLRYAGLDVHKSETVIAVADEGRGEAKLWGRGASDPPAVERELKKLGGPDRVRVCYEAGPTGYGLARHLIAAGYACLVVAPTLVPKETRRIKTDNRDALRLAHFLRSGSLTAVAIPDAATEAIRDLTRARDAAKRAERVTRHQLASSCCDTAGRGRTARTGRRSIGRGFAVRRSTTRHRQRHSRMRGWRWRRPRSG